MDTSAWIAVVNRRDQYHALATRLQHHLQDQRTNLVTTNFVIGEAYTAIFRSMGHRTALRFLDSIRQSGRLGVVYSDSELETQARAILARYPDQNFSYVDAVSFALMRQGEITQAFAFDHHFLVAGFTLLSLPET